MSGLNLLAVTSQSSFSSDDPAATATGLVIGLVIGLVFYLIYSFLLYRTFKKAGRPGWAAFVPVYNSWVLFEISGKPGWWSLAFVGVFIPLIGLIFLAAYYVLSLLAALELAKHFGKSTVFAVLGLWFFSPVGYIILAFDDSKYQAVPATSTAPPQNPSNPSNPTSTPNTSSESTPPSLVQ